MTPCPFWLMIVSTASAVLPVPRSPMISSRWPRPIGIIESIALMPVCSGSFTGWRSFTPGALYPRRRGSHPAHATRPVGGVAERVGAPTKQRPADGDARALAGAADRLAFLDQLPLAEQGGADV